MPEPQVILKALAQGGWEDHSTSKSVNLAMEKEGRNSWEVFASKMKLLAEPEESVPVQWPAYNR